MAAPWESKRRFGFIARTHAYLLAKGFRQIRVRAGDEPKTAFATPWGMFHHLVMTVGSASAAAHMQSVGNAMIDGNAEALPEFLYLLW